MKPFLLLLFSVLVSSQDCQLVVPPFPLTAAGLATPWRLLAPCNQSDPAMASFINGAILDKTTGVMAAFNPLVVTDGTAPAIFPPVITMPNNSVVALWFGTNAGTLTLVDNAGSILAGKCINGLKDSIFGQFAYCNAPEFFMAASTLIAAGILKVPPLGTANDGGACPTVRDFFIVDMDQSDNVITSYLNLGNSIAQDTTANRVQLPTATTLTNGSDMRLLSIAVDNAMACKPWKIQDLADPLNAVGIPVFGTAELQAATWQQPPVAITPVSHAMCRLNNQPNLDKTNAYRAGCGQPMALTVKDADSFQYCSSLYYVGPKRLALNAQAFNNFGSPDPAAATNLLAFLAQRYANSFGPDGLNCAVLLGVPPPIVPIKNMNGVFVGATITVPGAPGQSGQIQNLAGNGGITTNTLIIIVVCSVVGGLLLIGLIIGVIWYRNRAMYS